MRGTRRTVVSRLSLVAVVMSLVVAPSLLAARRPDAKAAVSIASILKPGLPLELVSAKKVDRIAWISYEEGKRNVFTAAAPTFAVVRATSFLKDDGVDLTGTKIELHTWMASDGTCTWKNGYRTYYGNYTEVKATTGADGKFRLDLRKSGRVILLAIPPKELAGRFPTAELGPLELDARVGAKGLEIKMTPGGAIEGRVLVPSGQSAAGRIVAMNHGDAEPFTVRTDEPYCDP